MKTTPVSEGMGPVFECPRIPGRPRFATLDTCARRKGLACKRWMSNTGAPRGGEFEECITPTVCPGPVCIATGKVVRVKPAEVRISKCQMSRYWAERVGAVA